MSNEASNGTVEETKLPLLPLIAFGVGSMVGAGIFSLPQNVAAKASPGAAILGWLICGIGMLGLAFVYQSLAATRPDVTGGVYGYAREGFGNFAGFASAWSYWISAWMGNLGYAVGFVLALNSFGFLGVLADDSDVLSAKGIILGLVLIWIMHFLILAGMRTAAFVNTVVTIIKVIPIIVFVVMVAVAFKVGMFTADFWGAVSQVGTGKDAAPLGSVASQLSKMMLVTVWVFIGIEGASVYSTRAKKSSDVGKATIISFVTVLALLVFVNLLSFGIMAQQDLSNLSNPSMAGVLEAAVGHWGAVLINIAQLISIGGAMLAWVMLAAEILFVPVADGNLPKVFGAVNSHESPTTSLWLTSIISSITLVIIVMTLGGGYIDFIYIAAGLILPCYILSALFQVKQTATGDKAVAGAGGSKAWRMFVGILGSIYTIWLLWAGGIGLLFMSCFTWILGLPLYIKGRKERGLEVFSAQDKPLVIISAILTVVFFLWIAWFGDFYEALFWNGLS